MGQIIIIIIIIITMVVVVGVPNKKATMPPGESWAEVSAWRV